MFPDGHRYGVAALSCASFKAPWRIIRGSAVFIIRTFSGAHGTAIVFGVKNYQVASLSRDIRRFQIRPTGAVFEKANEKGGRAALLLDAHESERSVFNDSACAVVTLDPVTLAHVLNTDFSAGARRVQETVVAEIDADVGEGAPHRIEENQIAGLKFVLVDDVTNFTLFFRRSGQQLTH